MLSGTEIYIHPGLWKTGTTYIQGALYSSRENLSRVGVYYPNMSRNHHFMASAFMNHPELLRPNKEQSLTGKADLAHYNASNLRTFCNGVASSEKTIVSSEFNTTIWAVHAYSGPI